MAVIQNLPNDSGEFLLDPNAGFYQAQPQGNSYVYVEKHAARKGDFESLPIGTAHDQRDAFLVKETNYTDIGGGLITFERHFAVLPNDWFTFELVTYVEQKRYTMFRDDEQTVLNPDSVQSGLFPFIEYTKNVTKAARATRRYYLSDDFDDTEILAETPGVIDPSGEQPVKADSFRIYMAGIYEVTSYIVDF
jgi:hypothetical protein